MKSVIDRAAATKLELFANNESTVYFGSLVPMYKTMKRKADKGTFDREKAVKGFMYTAEYAAKLYCKYFGGIWYKVFSKATRQAVAESLTDDFVTENT